MLPFDFTENIVALSPFGETQIRKDHGDERNHLAHRIPQKVDVGGKMHVGRDHEGIAAPGVHVSATPRQDAQQRTAVSVFGRPIRDRCSTAS